MTKEQIASINERLSKPNVKPIALYKTNSDSVILSCLNTNLIDPEPFTFIFYKNGNSRGMGYNFNLSKYELLFDFTKVAVLV